MHRDSLLHEIQDPATRFRAFWLHDERVPDELREDLHRHGHVLRPDPDAHQRRDAELIDRRRAWLIERGLR